MSLLLHPTAGGISSPPYNINKKTGGTFGSATCKIILNAVLSQDLRSCRVKFRLKAKTRSNGLIEHSKSVKTDFSFEPGNSPVSVES